MAKHSHNDRRAQGALRRLPDEKWADFNARQQTAMATGQTIKHHRIRSNYQRIADHVDGFDRDDLGLSPDY